MNDSTPTTGWDLQQRFEVDGVTLAWDRWGPDDGVPLVLAHGFSGSAFDWALQIPALSASRPVFALDHRGHGRSTSLGRTDTYSLDRLTADLAAFVAANVDGPFDLLGHSMGGVLAQQLVLDHEVDVRRLVLMDTSGTHFVSNDADTAAMISGFLAVYDPAGGLPDAMPPSPEDALIEAATPSAWQARKAELSAAFDPYAMKALGEVLLGGGEPLGLLERLGGVTLPTLVVVGSLDAPLTDRAAELAAALPAATTAVIEGAYHSPQLTHPDPWFDAVQAHVAP